MEPISTPTPSEEISVPTYSELTETQGETSVVEFSKDFSNIV